MEAVSHVHGERIQQDISQTKRTTVETGVQIFLLTATVDKRETQIGECMRQKEVMLLINVAIHTSV